MMFLLRFLLLACAAHAFSWFSPEPDYTNWSHEKLRTWLEHHNIKVPPSFDKSHLHDLVDLNWHSLSSPLACHAESARKWSLDQYNHARRAFEHINADAFDQWDESTLRAFLLEQGVIAPVSSREQLVLIAKNKFRAYTDAAAFYSSLASGSTSSAYASATGAANPVSLCVSSVVAQKTDEVARLFDETKDYVYSTWDDNWLRNWLRDNGVIEANSAHSRDELIRLINDYHHKANSAVWEGWSDSYIREWLVAHHLMQPLDTLPRSSLIGEMKKYYYKCSDKVWNTWSDSELKAWLVDHHFLESDAQISRNELISMAGEHYLSVADSVWGAWMDSDIRQWLSEHGYLEGRNDVKSRKDLIALMNDKCPGSETATPYLIWPDARLRAYLRETGMNENSLPTNRLGLLQETRTRWVQVSHRTETVFAKLKEIINSSVEAVEEKIARVLEILSEHTRDVVHYATGTVDDPTGCADMKASSRDSDRVHEGRETTESVEQFTGEQASGWAVRARRWAREKIQGAEGEL